MRNMMRYCKEEMRGFVLGMAINWIVSMMLIANYASVMVDNRLYITLWLLLSDLLFATYILSGVFAVTVADWVELKLTKNELLEDDDSE